MFTPRRVSGGGVRENGVPTCRTGAEEKKEVMSRKLNLTQIVLALAVTLGAGSALLSNVAQADDCGHLKIAEVQAECKKGGKDAVKKWMQAASKAHKKECKDCHSDQKEYKLKDNAEADLKAALAKK
jgi:hypothetical protein